MQNQRAGLDKKRVDVAAMFDGVAKRYDLFNTVLSLGQVHRWRRATVAAVAPRDAVFSAGYRNGFGHADRGSESAASSQHYTGQSDGSRRDGCHPECCRLNGQRWFDCQL